MKVILEEEIFYAGGSASGKSNLNQVVTPDLFNGDILQMKNCFNHGITLKSSETGPFFGENPSYIFTYIENKNIY